MVVEGRWYVVVTEVIQAPVEKTKSMSGPYICYWMFLRYLKEGGGENSPRLIHDYS